MPVALAKGLDLSGVNNANTSAVKRATLSHSIAQSIPNNAWTSVLFDTVVEDTDSIGATANQGTITTPGFYRIAFYGRFDGGTGTIRAARIIKNGSDLLSAFEIANASGQTLSILVAREAPLVAADVITVEVLQNDGSATDLQAGGGGVTMALQITRIGNS